MNQKQLNNLYGEVQDKFIKLQHNYCEAKGDFIEPKIDTLTSEQLFDLVMQAWPGNDDPRLFEVDVFDYSLPFTKDNIYISFGSYSGW
jgi:hypothetical protein